MRFLPDAAERAEASVRTLAPRGDRIYPDIYRSVILNGSIAGDWTRRVPPARLSARDERAQGALRLRLDENGVYGLPGSSLIAAGIPAGTPLGEIALFHQRFAWQGDQPEFLQEARARFFLDRTADGDLDADDTMVFLGRRLRDATASPDSVEWYGRGSALWVARAPELALEMASESGWADGAHAAPTSFIRHRRVYGESKFYWAPPGDLYTDEFLDQNPDTPPYSESWDVNQYYFRDPRPPLDSDYILELAIPSPGYVSGSAATLELYWQGQGGNSGDAARPFSLTLRNTGGAYSLPGFSVSRNTHPYYSQPLAAGRLVDGMNELAIDRTDGSQWFAMIKFWDLTYESRFEASGDSLYFHARGLAGANEFRVGGFTQDRDSWLLIRSDGGQPVRVTLNAVNQAGAPGDYELRFRDEVAGNETWWALDESALRMPGIEQAEPLASLDDSGPYDVLVIAHDLFAAGMQPWVAFREAQGYRVKLMRSSEVWDLFFSGCRGPRGMRNAARFAYQQWGAEAVLLVGDSSKDARGLDYSGDADPDFLPIHSTHEIVGGIDELVGLEEWIAKFAWRSLPAMLVGRLPVGSAAELEIILDKIMCYENYGESEGCDGAGDWRRRFLLVADDRWAYANFGSCSQESESERNFQWVQEAIIRDIVPQAIVEDVDAVPFYISAITEPWYVNWNAQNGCATSTDLQQYLRPTLAPVFIDSLSRGYSMVTLQSHANRATLGHEEYFKVAYGPSDHEETKNWGRPFFWIVYGCHGNAFASHNEGGVTGDCVGEKLLFVENRGAVASYASEGYEYLFPNIDIGKDHMSAMLLPSDPDDDNAIERFPQWTLGAIQAATEYRYGMSNYESIYRMNLLGDPLSRMDLAPPRVEVFVNGVRMADGEYLPIASDGDSLDIEAIVRDETYISELRLGAGNRDRYDFEKSAAWLPRMPDGALLVDVSIPADLELVGSVTIPGNAWSLVRDADSVYVADGAKGLKVLAVSNPSRPVVQKSVETPGYAYDVAVAGGYAYVADGASGLQTVDVLPLAAAGIVSSRPIVGGARAVAIGGGHLLVAGSAGLRTFSLATPAAPAPAGSLSLPGSAMAIAVGTGYACIADSARGVHIVSIGDFASPTLLATLETPGSPCGLALSGDILYVADGESGLTVADLSNPAAPVVIGSLDSPGWAWDVSVNANHAYLADELAGLHAISVANPAAPLLVGTIAMPGGSYARGVAVANQYAIVAHGMGPVDPLLAHTGLPLSAFTSPVDTLTANESDLSRAWYLRARVPYDFSMDNLAVEGIDLAGRRGRVVLPLAKVVEFSLGGVDSLRGGQWVRSEGELHIVIRVPTPAILPSQFGLLVDGVLTSSLAQTTDQAQVYLMVYAYQWTPGRHDVTVLLDGSEYGRISLNVDAQVRLTEGRIFPNPFRSITTFNYSLTGAVSRAELSIYTLSGRLVHRSELDELSEGEAHYTIWDGLDRSGDKVANGVYISRLVFTEPSGEQVVWEDKVVKMR